MPQVTDQGAEPQSRSSVIRDPASCSSSQTVTPPSLPGWPSVAPLSKGFHTPTPSAAEQPAQQPAHAEIGEMTRTGFIRVAGLLQRLDTTHGLRSDGPHLSPSITRSRVAPVAAWIFQPVHRAPATTKRDQAARRPGGHKPCRTTTDNTHTTPASTC